MLLYPRWCRISSITKFQKVTKSDSTPTEIGGKGMDLEKCKAAMDA